MKNKMIKSAGSPLIVLIISIMTSCSSSGNKKQNTMKNDLTKGTYGYDVTFFSKNKISTIELKDKDSKASALIVPAYQGRVMTSSVEGAEGISFGWINYKLIESGIDNHQFNPYGGEERLWLGPEGGPFSVYFKKDSEQVFANWVVPKESDTEPFEVVEQSPAMVIFRKDFELTNASGTNLSVGIERKVKLLNRPETENCLLMKLDKSLSFVAYESENTLINKGDSPWTEQTGALSVWMLAMFNPSPSGIVFIPFKEGSEEKLGQKVNDDYFGKVPADRLIVKDGILFFKIDGKHRSKIGISPLRAMPYCGSYDPDNKVLTLLWYSFPAGPAKYVNSKWGDQLSPFSGDVVNSYNDGPVEDGSVMGPFYEIESSSPAAFLKPGDKTTHIQRIFHLTGDAEKLTRITEKLFNCTLSDIQNAFNK